MNGRVIWDAVLLMLIAGTAAVGLDNTEVDDSSRDVAHLVDLFTVGGRPINQNADVQVTLLVNTGYVVGYAEERRNPLWTAYKASRLVQGDVSQAERFDRPQFFPADTRVLPSVDGRTFGGGFDRGHMVPNAVIGTQFGTLAQMETFFMTNMCPQKGALNQGPWARLEHFIPEEAADRKHIYVISGPIFGVAPAVVERGPERGIQIPEAFYMILVDTEFEFRDRPVVRLLAHRFPQDTDRDADFADRTLFGVSVNDIEAATGLDFFPRFGALFSDWETREDDNAAVHWRDE